MPITAQTRALVYADDAHAAHSGARHAGGGLSGPGQNGIGSTDRGDKRPRRREFRPAVRAPWISAPAPRSCRLQTLPDTNTALLFAYAPASGGGRRDGDGEYPRAQPDRLPGTRRQTGHPDRLLAIPDLTKTATASARGAQRRRHRHDWPSKPKALVVTPATDAFPDAGSVFTVDYDRRVTYSGTLAAIAYRRSYALQLPEEPIP